MSEIVIPDTSCLITLDSIGLLDILRSLYKEILIHEEIKLEFGASLPPWVKVHKLNKGTLQIAKVFLSLNLGKGEVEVLLCSVEKQGSIAVLDDKRARKVAQELELKYTGTLAILIKAKKVGLIGQLKPILNKLEQNDFRISNSLKQKALQLAEVARWEGVVKVNNLTIEGLKDLIPSAAHLFDASNIVTPTSSSFLYLKRIPSSIISESVAS